MASPSLAVALEQWNRLWKKNPTATNGNRGGKRKKENKRQTTNKTTRIHVQPTLYSFLDKEKCASNPTGGFGDDPLDRPYASHRIGFYNLHNFVTSSDKFGRRHSALATRTRCRHPKFFQHVCWLQIRQTTGASYRSTFRDVHELYLGSGACGSLSNCMS